MPPLSIRPAHPHDAPRIATIYNEGIRGRHATFETAERSAADITTWFARPHELPAHLSHPFLVAAEAEVQGWVRASLYRTRSAYLGIAEYSIYVAHAAQGRRVGDALMGAFVDACTAAGLVKLVSRIFPENVASLALCARHGFRVVGTYEKHGALDGAWRDVVIVERVLAANL